MSAKDAVRSTARAEAALFVLPPVPEPSREQIQAFAQHMGLEPYDARLRLSAPLPRLLRVGSRDALQGVAEGLVDDEVPALCLELPDVLGHGQGWHEALRVRQVELDGDTWVISGRRHTPDGKVVVEDTPHRLRPDAGGLLIRGRYEFHATGSVTVAFRGEVMTDRATADERVRFAHLYLPDQDWPFEFLEDELDYGFLGPEKTFVSSTNFGVLLSRLSQGPAKTTCAALERHSGHVKDSVSMPASASYQGSTVSASALVTASDSEAGANSLSRLLRHLWATPSLGSEALQRAAEALLRDEEASARSSPTARAPDRPRPDEPDPALGANPASVTPAQREAARGLARELARRGHTAERIRRRLLVDYPLAAHQADVLVEEAVSLTQAHHRARGKLVLAIGAALLVLGLAGIGLSAAPHLIALRIAAYVLGGAGALVALLGGLQVATGQDLLMQVLDTE